MTLLALYAGSLVLGGILIAASMLGAGKDTDGPGADGEHGLDHGLDHDHDHDHGLDHGHELAKDIPVGGDHDPGQTHGDASRISAFATTLLSLRFWTFALAAFGMTGLLLHAMSIHPFLTLGLAVVTGFGVGAGVTTLLRTVSRDTVSSALDSRTLRGRDAEVVLTMGPGKLGKIRLIHNGQIIDLPATTKEGRLIERGERVLVVDVSAGMADVTPITPDRRAHVPHSTTT
ncbi:MAG: hypothetical protein Q8P41_20945 [Pseudomonadota bacterium]|nr:hypothetical protein [Pseudomonadota bacterium]